jgi:hypothetical protein
MMEGFSFVTPVTGLNRPNTGKEDDDDNQVSSVLGGYVYDCITIAVLSIFLLS